MHNKGHRQGVEPYNSCISDKRFTVNPTMTIEPLKLNAPVVEYVGHFVLYFVCKYTVFIY